MCGVWGFITTERTNGAHSRLKFLQQAAIAGTMRGFDSAGAVFVPHDRNEKDPAAGYFKTVGTGMDLLTTKGAEDFFNHKYIGEMRAVLGHNRAATQGKVTLANAHPFQEGPITLIHNGTLSTTYDMPMSMFKANNGLKKQDQIEVDSHLICYNLAHENIDDVIGGLDGAFTLLWHDARDDKVRAIRNSQRPLMLLPAKCESTILFASEADMLWWIAGRTNFSRGEVVQLDPGVLLEWSPGELKPKARRVELYKPKSYASHWKDGQYGGGTSSTGKKQAPATLQAVGATTTKKLKESLDFLGFDPKEELEFSVTSIIPTPGRQGRCTVNGWVMYENGGRSLESMPAMVHGVLENSVKELPREGWTVRPVGVIYRPSRKDETEPVLVCRLVSVPSPSSKSWVNTLVGPGGEVLTYREWMALTKDGCGQCKATLTSVDAPNIIWCADEIPICPKCKNEWLNDATVGGMC